MPGSDLAHAPADPLSLHRRLFARAPPASARPRTARSRREGATTLRHRSLHALVELFERLTYRATGWLRHDDLPGHYGRARRETVDRSLRSAGEATDQPRFATSGEVSNWGAVVSIAVRDEVNQCSRCCGRSESAQTSPRLGRASRSWTKDVALAFAAAKRHSTCAVTRASLLALLSARPP